MNENKTNINWYPGHMAKTKREIKENLQLIDVVYELLDARIPYSSKNKDIDELIKNKPKILIMTKTDLCDLEITKKWQQYYENMGYKVILTDLINNKNIKQIIEVTSSLSDNMNKKRLSLGMKPRKTRVLILGVPNVGKSTLINRLVGKKAAPTGDKPGITKKLNWIRINDKLELLDTPGILEPKLENKEVALNLAALTSIKEEVLDLEQVALHIIDKMLNLYPNTLKTRYNLTNTNTSLIILNQIAKQKGAIKKGEVDYEKVYKIILRDLKEGYLGNITFDPFDNKNILP
ncbi:MAG: ribosome biogenesis GTPase YlqF [Bacilli bacterium]